MTAVQLINIQRLLEAAEFLERRERGKCVRQCVYVCVEVIVNSSTTDILHALLAARERESLLLFYMIHMFT